MPVAQPTSPRADPRPRVEDGPGGPVVVGTRCLACGQPSSIGCPRCPRCGGENEEARFGAEGAIWSTTTIHVPSGGREAPYTLAYVDLDGGPRVLAHVRDGLRPAPRLDGRVRLAGPSAGGDVEVEVLE